MPKVTKAYQVPLPPTVSERTLPDVEERLRLFDEATRRQREREARNPPIAEEQDRGWKREDLYRRGRSD